LRSPVRYLGRSFLEFNQNLDKVDKQDQIAVDPSLIHELVYNQRARDYRQANSSFASILKYGTVEDFHNLSQRILGERAKFGKYNDKNLSVGLCQVVTVFDNANLKVHGLREPVKHPLS
jgi:hypothetical protein